jgi:hypothetical protein
MNERRIHTRTDKFEGVLQQLMLPFYSLIIFMNMFYILITPTFQSPLVPVGCVFEAQLNQVYKKGPHKFNPIHMHGPVHQLYSVFFFFFLGGGGGGGVGASFLIFY